MENVDNPNDEIAKRPSRCFEMIKCPGCGRAMLCTNSANERQGKVRSNTRRDCGSWHVTSMTRLADRPDPRLTRPRDRFRVRLQSAYAFCPSPRCVCRKLCSLATSPYAPKPQSRTVDLLSLQRRQSAYQAWWEGEQAQVYEQRDDVAGHSPFCDRKPLFMEGCFCVGLTVSIARPQPKASQLDGQSRRKSSSSTSPSVDVWPIAACALGPIAHYGPR